MKIQLSLNAFLFVSLLFIFLIYIFFIYRRTNPIVSRPVHIILILLRSIAAIGILLLLFEPILQIYLVKRVKPTVAVLVDTSASMALKDVNVKRDSVLLTVLQQPWLDDVHENRNIVFYKMVASSNLSTREEILQTKFSGDASNISGSLQQVKEELSQNNLAAIVIMSDGAYNLGGNPIRYAEQVGVPVYAVGIGSEEEVKDLAISQMTVNKLAYLGSSTPVKVKLRNLGYPETSLTLSIKMGSGTITSRVVRLPKGPADKEVELSITPKSEGQQDYRIELSPVEGEQTDLNNTRSFSIKVLNSKMKVLVLSGSVNADLGFLVRALERDENFEVSKFVEKSYSETYGHSSSDLPDFLSYDVVIAMDYPTSTSNKQVETKFFEALNEDRVPIVLLFGFSTNTSLLKEFANQLPVMSISTTNERLASVKATSEGLSHPITRMVSEGVSSNWDWQHLPPLYHRIGSCKLWPDARVLLEFEDKKSVGNPKKPLPLIAVRDTEGRRSVAVFGYGLWRWQLMMAGVDAEDGMFDRFISNLVRWPTKIGRTEKVLFTTSKESYHIGETVEIQAEVYDDAYKPVSDAQVLATIRNGTKVWNITLESTENGQYSTGVKMNVPGDYIFQGRAEVDGIELGSSEGHFTVGAYEVELLDTRAHLDALKALARESGGRFFYPDSAAVLNQILPSKPTRIKTTLEIELWNRVLFLMIILAALVLEWFIRKRKGMV